jgi:phosphate-selective porin OprO/OprP
MSTKSRSRNRGCGAAIAFCAAMLPVVADAQDAAIDRIEAIERKIRWLESELQHLKSELGEAKQQLRRSRNEAQRAREEVRQAREAAEQARQDALKAASAEAQATQAVAPALPSPASGGGLKRGQAQAAAAASPAAVAASEGVEVSMPHGRPTIATADGRLSLAIGGLMLFDMGGYFQNPNPNTQFPQLNNGVKLRRGRLYFIGRFDDFRLNITPDFGGSPDGTPTLFEANAN